MTFDKKKSATR